jgi:hypothetical protein
MPTDFYDGLLMIVMALTLAVLGFLTITQSWKQGNFVAITAAISLLLLGVAALIEQLFGATTISMFVFGGAVIVFLFLLFFVAPMSFRRQRKRKQV